MEHYDLQLERFAQSVRDAGAKRVLVQLPDGLKPQADAIRAFAARELPSVEVSFWGGSAFGSCDLPLQVERLGFDLLVHFGHAAWR